MSLISYNCRGLGNPRSVGRLKTLLGKENSDVVFLMETKLGADRMSSVQNKLQMQKGYHVDAMGRSGGMSILWSDNVDINVLSSFSHYIDFTVRGLFTDVE